MSSRFLTLVLLTAVPAELVAAQSATEAVDRVANWAAPLYWQASGSRLVPQRAGAGRKPSATVETVTAAASSGTSAPAVFVAMTPCRVVDTRAGILPFGSPNFAAGEIRTIPMPTSPDCPVPSNALAYSLNIAVVPLTGSMRWLTAWNTGAAQPATATLNDKAGVVTSNSAVVPAGDSGSINVYVTDPTHLIIDINGYYISSMETPNRQAIAQLKWIPGASASFAVGVYPMGVAFDGANIWVANCLGNNVTKLRATDGANLGSFNVVLNPVAVAFDGANIWVANYRSNNVTKLRASDGFTLGSFDVGMRPNSIAFDGVNIWVANFQSDSMTKLRASDGVNLGSFNVGTSPHAAAFDGANIWVTNESTNTVTKLRASDGANLGSFKVGTRPYAVAFDGSNIWVANFVSNNVTKLRASDGVNLGSFNVGAQPHGVAFDGANIWIANFGSNNVTKMRPSDGATLGTFSVGNEPSGVAFDGANIWVTNSADYTVTKL